MLAYMQDQSLRRQGVFVPDVEHGNEIIEDAGVTWLRDFKVNAELRINGEKSKSRR